MARKKPVPQCKQHLLVPALMSSEKLVLIKCKTEKGEWYTNPSVPNILKNGRFVRVRKGFKWVSSTERKVYTRHYFVSKYGWFTETRISHEYLLSDNSIVQGESFVEWYAYNDGDFTKCVTGGVRLKWFMKYRRNVDWTK